MLSDRCLSACVSVCYVSVSCNVGVLWPNGWLDQDALTTEVGFGPDDIVLDGDPAPRHRKGQPPPLFGPLCSGTVAHLSICRISTQRKKT